MILAKSSQCLGQAQVQNCWQTWLRNQARPAQLLLPVLQNLQKHASLQGLLHVHNGVDMPVDTASMMIKMITNVQGKLRPLCIFQSHRMLNSLCPAVELYLADSVSDECGWVLCRISRLSAAFAAQATAATMGSM